MFGNVLIIVLWHQIVTLYVSFFLFPLLSPSAFFTKPPAQLLQIGK